MYNRAAWVLSKKRVFKESIPFQRRYSTQRAEVFSRPSTNWQLKILLTEALFRCPSLDMVISQLGPILRKWASKQNKQPRLFLSRGAKIPTGYHVTFSCGLLSNIVTLVTLPRPWAFLVVGHLCSHQATDQSPLTTLFETGFLQDQSSN